MNPFTYRVYQAALYPYLQLFEPAGKITTVDLLSFFGPWLRENGGNEWYWLPTFYLAVVALGLGRSLLNADRFSWSRFLPFALISVIWGIFMHANPVFAVVFAAVVGLNGQEWYLDRFGTEGRLGGLWRTWSTGGRLVTLGLVFFMMCNDITGRANTLHDVRFGLGFNRRRLRARGGDVSGEPSRNQGKHPEHVHASRRRIDLEKRAAAQVIHRRPDSPFLARD